MDKNIWPQQHQQARNESLDRRWTRTTCKDIFHICRNLKTSYRCKTHSRESSPCSCLSRSWWANSLYLCLLCRFLGGTGSSLLSSSLSCSRQILSFSSSSSLSTVSSDALILLDFDFFWSHWHLSAPHLPHAHFFRAMALNDEREQLMGHSPPDTEKLARQKIPKLYV